MNVFITDAGRLSWLQCDPFFAPLVALGAVLFTRPVTVAPVFSDIFMDKLIGFVKLYFPVFLLGAVFGKLIEFAGFYYSIVSAVTCMVGQNKAMPMIILVCALLTYGGVSLFVVAFANLFFTWLIPHIYGDQFMINLPGLKKPL